MAAVTTGPDFTLTLAEEERAQLLSFLEQALRHKQVEAHRTDSIDYRQSVEHEESILRGLVDRLRKTPHADPSPSPGEV